MFNKKNTISNNREPLKIWVWSLVSVFVFCIFSYIYLVQGAIVNIVARQNMETELSALNSKVVDLETQYMKAKKTITPELAQGLGFVVVSNQKFVTRNTTNDSGLSVLTSGM